MLLVAIMYVHIALAHAFPSGTHPTASEKKRSPATGFPTGFPSAWLRLVANLWSILGVFLGYGWEIFCFPFAIFGLLATWEI
jgi:hypothetical protein